MATFAGFPLHNHGQKNATVIERERDGTGEIDHRKLEICIQATTL